jgi:hypothetical protein
MFIMFTDPSYVNIEVVLPIQIIIYEYLDISCLVIKFILWQGQKAYLACTSTPRSE